MERRTVMIYGSIVVVIGTVAYIVFNKEKKKKILEEINKSLETGTGAYGGSEDLQTSQAFDPKYVVSSGSTNLLTELQALRYAKEINDNLGGTGVFAGLGSNGSKVVNVFKQLKNQAQAAQIAKEFSTTYKKDMYNSIKAIDNTVLGIGSSNYMKQIQQIINSLPAK